MSPINSVDTQNEYDTGSENETSKVVQSDSEDIISLDISESDDKNASNPHVNLHYDNDDFETSSSVEIKKVEKQCSQIFDVIEQLSGEMFETCKKSGIIDDNHQVLLQKRIHIDYLKNALISLPTYAQSLTQSKPWILFYLLHTLSILKEKPTDLYDDILIYLNKCQTRYGGYSGSQYDYPHLMVTYAAVMTIAIIGKPEGFASINRPAMYLLFMSLKHDDGSFSVHENGESDIRGTYCALCICKVLNMLTDEITSNVENYIHSLLSYDGGYGGDVGGEAHGGYNQCALACLHILNVDYYTPELDTWITLCQSPLEGGFAGRTCKLVDGCYTWYQGAGMEMIAENRPNNQSLSCNVEGIKRYAVFLCQDINFPSGTVEGGLRDKPNVYCDFYHTCYVLSGLSVLDAEEGKYNLEFIDPIYNISYNELAGIVNYFKDKPFTENS